VSEKSNLKPTNTEDEEVEEKIENDAEVEVINSDSIDAPIVVQKNEVSKNIVKSNKKSKKNSTSKLNDENLVEVESKLEHNIEEYDVEKIDSTVVKSVKETTASSKKTKKRTIKEV
jgi:hypothetical protein